ncbi:hypothetical protein IIA15_01020 [candidate division TA06 bacterium]|nr:hypothetical protein [candidate division TA06 bacterium]
MVTDEQYKEGYRWTIWTKDWAGANRVCKNMPFLNRNRVLVLDYDTFIPIENVLYWERLTKEEIAAMEKKK